MKNSRIKQKPDIGTCVCCRAKEVSVVELDQKDPDTIDTSWAYCEDCWNYWTKKDKGTLWDTIDKIWEQKWKKEGKWFR